jgi:two-component system NtrC family sensor kinase
MNVRITIAITLSLQCILGPVVAQDRQSYDEDTARVMKLISTAQRYRFFKPDSSVPFATEALRFSESINFPKGKIAAYIVLGEYHRVSGNYPESLENLFQALKLSNETGDSLQAAEAQGFIGMTYLNLKEYRTALQYLFQSYAKEKILSTPMTGFLLSNTGIAYQEMNMLDSALLYQKRSWAIAQNSPMAPGRAFVLRAMGNVYNQLEMPDSAFYYYRYALNASQDILNTGRTYSRMAIVYLKLKEYDSTLYYASRALILGRTSSQKPTMLEASKTLATYYIVTKKLDSAVKYQQITMNINDSLYGSEQLRRIQIMAIEEQKKLFQATQKQQQIEQEQTQYRNRIKMYLLLALLAALLLFGMVLYRNNRRKQTANRLLEKQKTEIERTLTELRSTQQQLIQSEKMASLGELTAGIAHEIQNPLNFVNNFSEVNTELIEEIKGQKSKLKSEELDQLLEDISKNNEKINHHGKRADAIVKGMLQHSRSSSGQKEPTDINTLADEYLRLAYHGLRAKDKTFNATMKTDFDASIENMNIIPQDIGRVILNLITNAFYAAHRPPDKGFKDPNYIHIPTVWVSTKKKEDRVLISVRDNGPGIPQKIVDKIFQPFFTTKPTGQGTGLGLSLSYDIVKAHGGEIKVETKENEGTEFIVVLPLQA